MNTEQEYAAHRVDLFDGREDVLCEKAEPKTRSNVESYLKGKGWDGGDLKTKSGNRYHIIESAHGFGWVLGVIAAIKPEDFDTAPEQLAEAILTARILNAVK